MKRQPWRLATPQMILAAVFPLSLALAFVTTLLDPGDKPRVTIFGVLVYALLWLGVVLRLRDARRDRFTAARRG